MFTRKEKLAWLFVVLTFILAGITFGLMASSPANAATTAQAAPQNAKVYGPHGNQCFVTPAVVPYQYDIWSPNVGAMTTIPHLSHCTAFSYVKKTEHLVQAGSKGKRCLTFVHDGSYYIVEGCLPHDRKSQKAYFSSVDHGKYAEIHFRYNGGYCVTLNMNQLTQNPPGASLKPEDCGANDSYQFFKWHNPARKHRAPSLTLTAFTVAAAIRPGILRNAAGYGALWFNPGKTFLHVKGVFETSTKHQTRLRAGKSDSKFPDYFEVQIPNGKCMTFDQASLHTIRAMKCRGRETQEWRLVRTGRGGHLSVIHNLYMDGHRGACGNYVVAGQGRNELLVANCTKGNVRNEEWKHGG